MGIPSGIPALHALNLGGRLTLGCCRRVRCPLPHYCSPYYWGNVMEAALLLTVLFSAWSEWLRLTLYSYPDYSYSRIASGHVLLCALPQCGATTIGSITLNQVIPLRHTPIITAHLHIGGT